MLIPPGYVLLGFVWSRSQDPETMFTGLGYSWDGSTDYQDIVNDSMAAWGTSLLRGATTTNTYLERVEGRFGTLGPGDLVVESDLATLQGNSTDDTLPSNCSILVKKLTLLGGRKNRGRFFYPDASRNVVDVNGNIDSAGLDDYRDAFASFFDALDGVDGLGSPVLFHSDDADPPTPISSFVVQPKIATQRRRMRP